MRLAPPQTPQRAPPPDGGAALRIRVLINTNGGRESNYVMERIAVPAVSMAGPEIVAMKTGARPRKLAQKGALLQGSQGWGPLRRKR